MQLSDRAIYLPAISEVYARHNLNQPFARPCSVYPRDLNFLDPKTGLFAHQYALFSAGQGIKHANATSKPTMIGMRNRQNTVLLADSGGFQIQNGTIPFKGEETTLKLLRWMEAHGDYSMVLDFPTGGISQGTVRKHVDRLKKQGHDIDAMSSQNGLGLEFNACLKQTCLNNDLMVKERRPGETKLLNVIQGRNEAESREWYQAVRHYPFEGWALAGGHQTSFSMVLNRILDLWRDGLLQNTQWLHVLGISKIWAAVALTTLQRCIRAHVNPELQISFDSASPFRGAANNVINIGYILDRFGWSFVSQKAVGLAPAYDRLTLTEWIELQNPPGSKADAAGFTIPRSMIWADTAIGSKMRVADLWSNNGKDTPDDVGVALLMNHNVQVLLSAFNDAHVIAASGDLEQVPTEYFSLNTLIKKAFDTPDPRKFVSQAKRQLDVFAHL